jgi:hypothetical protein
MNTVWEIINSPAVVALIVSGVVYLINKLYAAKPTWQKYQGYVIAAIRYAEKAIPDDTKHKSAARLDEALKYVIAIIEKAEARKLSDQEITELINGIQITHNNIEGK